MNTNSTTEKQPQTSEGGGRHSAKKPDVKPQVRHERVFETMALTCGKVQVTQRGCGLNRKTS